MSKTAKERIDTGTLKARGYRILLEPIAVKRGLEKAQIDVAPTLAKAGFVTKTEHQAEREDAGTNWGIVRSIGPQAFRKMRDNEDNDAWAELGDIVCFRRYEGAKIEFPPGSGRYVVFINDEDIFGGIDNE